MEKVAVELAKLKMWFDVNKLSLNKKKQKKHDIWKLQNPFNHSSGFGGRYLGESF